MPKYVQVGADRSRTPPRPTDLRPGVTDLLCNSVLFIFVTPFNRLFLTASARSAEWALVFVSSEFGGGYG